MTDSKELALFYHALAEQYLSKIYSLETLERGFMECATPFIPGNPDAPLKFLRLANRAHIDRIDAHDMDMLNRLYESLAQYSAAADGRESADPFSENVGSAGPAETLDFLKRTVFPVMTEDPDSDAKFMFFEDLYDRGLQPANALVFTFHDRIQFDSDGRVDKAAEAAKTRIFQNVKQQFEELALRKTGTILRLVRI